VRFFSLLRMAESIHINKRGSMESPGKQKMSQNTVIDGERGHLFTYTYANVFFWGQRECLLLFL